MLESLVDGTPFLSRVLLFHGDSVLYRLVNKQFYEVAVRIFGKAGVTRLSSLVCVASVRTLSWILNFGDGKVPPVSFERLLFFVGFHGRRDLCRRLEGVKFFRYPSFSENGCSLNRKQASCPSSEDVRSSFGWLSLLKGAVEGGGLDDFRWFFQKTDTVSRNFILTSCGQGTEDLGDQAKRGRGEEEEETLQPPPKVIELMYLAMKTGNTQVLSFLQDEFPEEAKFVCFGFQIDAPWDVCVFRNWEDLRAVGTHVWRQLLDSGCLRDPALAAFLGDLGGVRDLCDRRMEELMPLWGTARSSPTRAACQKALILRESVGFAIGGGNSVEFLEEIVGLAQEGNMTLHEMFVSRLMLVGDATLDEDGNEIEEKDFVCDLPVVAAAATGRIDVLMWLWNHEPPFAYDERALMAAVYDRQPETFRWLLQNGWYGIMGGSLWDVVSRSPVPRLWEILEEEEEGGIKYELILRGFLEFIRDLRTEKEREEEREALETSLRWLINRCTTDRRFPHVPSVFSSSNLGPLMRHGDSWWVDLLRGVLSIHDRTSARGGIRTPPMDWASLLKTLAKEGCIEAVSVVEKKTDLCMCPVGSELHMAHCLGTSGPTRGDLVGAVRALNASTLPWLRERLSVRKGKSRRERWSQCYRQEKHEGPQGGGRPRTVTELPVWGENELEGSGGLPLMVELPGCVEKLMAHRRDFLVSDSFVAWKRAEMEKSTVIDFILANRDL
uniref:Uncharacterized protein n=1 Tax=Chromera velia CCMP2878 TaxID=1169474 RepID=A0A0G4G1Q2_9ALVE|eukprot:Cvel_4042.t1-p1 / transcript=Cvel_4042.t1 / gene=Cvel_4042 / organism=Chromera_velia_CCMP2878 / gene_product=hypothetical protein / transcript_product=hypothetical protein / location=Cvel_scaffold172:9373-13419(+) / protein_length=722 / sequence_SO=supercontig / SO=protein_coding / is_pseudo=false